eukprot:3700951-Alexandrium_andersonii.AAC.1
MQNRFMHSNLELRGPRNGLNICPRNSRAVRSAPCFFHTNYESADEMGDRGEQRGVRGAAALGKAQETARSATAP